MDFNDMTPIIAWFESLTPEKRETVFRIMNLYVELGIPWETSIILLMDACLHPQ